MNDDIAKDATDLTQLSSREQLSALMDGALPADETRFLLRRLQHDGSLAECWERWRLSAEVMRGLAPAQRLPADFASRVAVSLRGEEAHAVGTGGTRQSVARSPAWLRWGGGAAVAASLAVAAVMTRPAMAPAPAAAAVAIANAASPVPDKAPAPQPLAQDPGSRAIESQAAALATAVAAAARPTRNSRRDIQARTTDQAAGSQRAVSQLHATEAVVANGRIPALLPQVDNVSRPWPRSVLPQYADTGISVGFGDSARGAAPYNPFQARASIGGLAPELITHPPRDINAPESGDTHKAASSEPAQP